MRLIAARSGLTKFHYDFFDEREQPVGALKLPTGLAVADDSPVPAVLQDRVRFELPGGDCELHFTRAGRERHFTLERLEQPIATAIAAGPQGLSVTVAGRDLQLVKHFSLLRVRFEVREGGRSLGFIFEPALFTLVRRHFVIQLPEEVTDEARALLFFLVINATFR